MGSIPAILVILRSFNNFFFSTSVYNTNIINFQNKTKTKVKIKQQPKNTKHKYHKKNYWTNRNKWNFFFINSLFIYKNNNKNKNTLFRSLNSDSNFFLFSPNSFSLEKLFAVSDSQSISLFTGLLKKYNNFSSFFSFIPTNSIFFVYYFYLNNKISTFFSPYNPNLFFLINNKKKKTYNLNYNYFFKIKKKKEVFFNNKITSKNFVNKNDADSEGFFNLIMSFYKKNQYGFFLLTLRDIYSETSLRLSNNFQNFNKFLIFKTTKKNTQNSFFFLKNLFLYYYFPKNIFFEIKNNIFTKYGLNLKKKNNTKYDSYSSYLKLLLNKTNKTNKTTSNFTNKTNFIFNKNKINSYNNVFFSLKPLNDLLLSSNLEFFLNIFFNSIFFKFFLLKTNSFIFNQIHLFKTPNLNNYFFYSKHKKSPVISNILPVNSSFSYVYKKYLIRMFNYKKFSSVETPFHYESLVKFLEYSSGKKIFISINPFMINVLTFEEQARCLIWSQKIRSFRKVLGHRLFLNESLQIIYMCLKNKDLSVLSSWMLQMFYKISFWKYKMLFRYMQYILRYFFWTVIDSLKITGLKFQMKGKISVAGNARTRTVLTKIGVAGHSTFKNRILHDLKLIRTFTGVIGFKTWMFF